MAVAAVAHSAAQRAFGLDVDKAVIGNTVAAAVGQRIVGLTCSVGGHSEGRLVHRQGAVGKADGVVGAGQAARGNDVAARIGGALAVAAVAQGAAQHAAGLAVDKAVVRYAVAAAVGQAVVGFACGVGFEGERGFVHR